MTALSHLYPVIVVASVIFAVLAIVAKGQLPLPLLLGITSMSTVTGFASYWGEIFIRSLL